MNNDLFETAPIKKAYVTLVIPVVLSMLVTMIYNIVDTFFIARTGDPNIVAGVSLSAPLFLLLVALGDLFGIGGSTLVARLFGEKKDDDGTKVSAFSFYIAFFTGIVVAILLLVFRGFLLPVLGATTETLESARQYFSIIAIGSPFIMVSYIPANMLRTEGLAKEGMIGTIIGAVVNIILDPILISALSLGARGAALATVIGNICTDIYFIWFFSRRNLRISINIKLAHIDLKYVGMIIAVGVPACVTNVMSSFAQAVTNRNLLPYGTESIAAMGIVIKLHVCVCMVMAGMAFGSQPLIAFNFGSRNKAHLKEVIRFCLSVLIIASAVMAAILIIFAPLLIKAFMNDPLIIEYGTKMLRILEIGTILMAVNMGINCICQSFGKGIAALLLSTGRQGYVFIIVMLIASHAFGFMGVISAQLISEIICFIMAVIIFINIIKKELS